MDLVARWPRARPRTGRVYTFGALTPGGRFTTFIVRARDSEHAFALAEARVAGLKETGEVLVYGLI